MTRIFLSALLALPISGLAAEVSISPVIIRADDSERVFVVSLTNRGASEATFQLDIERWTQDGQGNSIREPTRDLLAAPMVRVAPGAKRAVRVARQSTEPGQYVLVLREILPARQEGESGMRFPSHFRLPAIFENKGGLVELSASFTAEGLLVKNSGSLAAHITSAGPQGGQAWKTGHLGWALPSGSTLLPYKSNVESIVLTVNGEPVVLRVR